jgi:hypothetical protein
VPVGHGEASPSFPLYSILEMPEKYSFIMKTSFL